MKNALKAFPWFEVILIVGLAIALIVKPQGRVLSATPQADRIGTSGGSSVLPVSTSTQPQGGL